MLLFSIVLRTTPIKSNPKTIIVPEDYPTIQEAIDAADGGDVIYVKAGIYHEHLTISKNNLALVGENKYATIIDGDGTGDVVCITANNVKITGFTIRGSGRGGLDSAVYITSDRNNISYNIVADSLVGILVYKGDQNAIVGNDASNNWRGIQLWAKDFEACTHNFITSNDFSNSEDCGILIQNSYYNTIVDNNVSCSSGEAIFMDNSDHNSIVKNNLSNSRYGIVFFSSTNNVIEGNNISRNEYGVRLTKFVGDWENSKNNKFFHNNFIDNQNNAWIYQSAPNIWDNGYPSGGNYWSNYVGSDIYSGPYQNETGSDGICDSPYAIAGNNIDHYPLMQPFHHKPINIQTVSLPVPYESQGSTDWCGPACLAMVLRYYGKNVHVWDIAKDFWWGFGLPKNWGTNIPQLVRFVQDRYPEFVVEVGKYKSFTDKIWNSIKSNLMSGYPVILSIRCLDDDTRHFLVITGFNLSGVFINDPSGALFEWLPKRMPRVYLHVFVTWEELQPYIETGIEGEVRGTYFVIKGVPSSTEGSISLGKQPNVRFKNKSNELAEMYIDLDRGLVWKGINHELYVSSNDLLEISCLIHNHNNISNDYKLIISLVDSYGNKLALDQTDKHISPYNETYYYNSSLNLTSLLSPDKTYVIQLELYDFMSNELIDQVRLPPVLYEPSGTIITLHEEQQYLFMHVYNVKNRFVGFDVNTNTSRVEIPHAFYYNNLNGTSLIMLPANEADFTIVIESNYSHYASEMFTLTVKTLKSGNIVDETSVHSGIDKGARKQFLVEITSDMKVKIQEINGNEDLLPSNLWYMMLFIIIIVMCIVVYLVRKARRKN